ncbi:MAG: hypothetical protein ACR2O5_10100 [Thiogranum sp.]
MENQLFAIAEAEVKSAEVLRLRQFGREEIAALLAPYGLICEQVGDNDAIHGSFWGDSEAGLVATRLLVRADTPVHSILHEVCHYVCMTPDRRDGLHTDAGGDYDEENAVCYLQILLAGQLPGVGRARMMQDMDAWGYSFRLGSTRAWFTHDAEDARLWLLAHGLVDDRKQPTWMLRQL